MELWRDLVRYARAVFLGLFGALIVVVGGIAGVIDLASGKDLIPAWSIPTWVAFCVLVATFQVFRSLPRPQALALIHEPIRGNGRIAQTVRITNADTVEWSRVGIQLAIIDPRPDNCPLPQPVPLVALNPAFPIWTVSLAPGGLRSWHLGTTVADGGGRIRAEGFAKDGGGNPIPLSAGPDGPPVTLDYVVRCDDRAEAGFALEVSLTEVTFHRR